MDIKIGSAPDSWGVWFPEDKHQTPWNRFLDEIAAAGYEWTELGPYGYLPTHVPTLIKELKKRNLKVSGTFAMDSLVDPKFWPSLEKQVLGAGAILKDLGAHFLILIDGTYTDLFTGEQLMPSEFTDDEWKKAMGVIHYFADTIKKGFGMQLVFHPHVDTRIEYEHQIEKLLEDTDPALVSLCLDTGHHVYRGGNAVAFMRKHHQRIKYLHLKNVDPGVMKKVNEERISLADAVAMEVFSEPSQGMVDFIAFKNVLKEIQFNGWAIVEQDMYPAPFDKPFPIAKRTRDYFKQIGLG